MGRFNTIYNLIRRAPVFTISFRDSAKVLSYRTSRSDIFIPENRLRVRKAVLHEIAKTALTRKVNLSVEHARIAIAFLIHPLASIT